MDNNFSTLKWGPLVTRQYIDPQITQELYNLGIKSTLPFNTFIHNNLEQETLYNEQEVNSFSLKLSPYIDNYLVEHNQYYQRSSYSPSKNWSLDALWINVMKDNQFREPHMHYNCDLSFVIYIKIPIKELKEESNPLAGTTIFHCGDASDNRAKIHNIDSHTIYPYENEMIIFPNNLLHYSVPFQNPNITRITVSGNVSLN